MFIHKVRNIQPDMSFSVDGTVKCVYDTTGKGDLIPVAFTQIDATEIVLNYTPSGQVYYRYKKKQ